MAKFEKTMPVYDSDRDHYCECWPCPQDDSHFQGLCPFGFTSVTTEQNKPSDWSMSIDVDLCEPSNRSWEHSKDDISLSKIHFPKLCPKIIWCHTYEWSFKRFSYSSLTFDARWAFDSFITRLRWHCFRFDFVLKTMCSEIRLHTKVERGHEASKSPFYIGSRF